MKERYVQNLKISVIIFQNISKINLLQRIENLDPSYLGDTMQHNMEKITFENCIFQKIQAFTFENFQNLKEIEFKSSYFENIDKDAFKMWIFPHPGFPTLELSFKNISMSDSKPLILSNVILKNWHTDMFQSNAEGKIEISNRYIPILIL